MPTGVSALPRLAATVSRTTTGMFRAPRPARSSVIRVSGTKAINATSLVMTMEEKKHSSASSAARLRAERARPSSAADRRGSNPVLARPETAAIRQKSSASVRKSICDRVASVGGTKRHVVSAKTKEMLSTASLRAQAKNRDMEKTFPSK